MTTISVDRVGCLDDIVYIWGSDINYNQYGLFTCQGLLDCMTAICSLYTIPGMYIITLQINNATKPNISPLTKITLHDASCTEGVSVELFIVDLPIEEDCTGFINCETKICKLHAKQPGLIGFAILPNN